MGRKAALAYLAAALSMAASGGAAGRAEAKAPRRVPLAHIGLDTLISHRGESVDAPENTLPAYETAVSRGFGFECDVYLSKDGRVFTFHDKNLKRTTAGANTNACADVTWAELEKLDVGGWGKWKGSKFEGTRPALLEEVLALARDGRKIYVEVKPGPEIVPYIKKIVDGQRKATPANTVFICGNTNTCRAVKTQMPDFKVYWVAYSKTSWRNGVPRKAADVVETLKYCLADGLDVHYNPEIVTRDFVKTVKDAGFEFHVWTVDSLSDTLEAFRRGAETVTTNCAKKQLDEYKENEKAAAAAREAALAEVLDFGRPQKSYYEAVVKHAGLQAIHADGGVSLRLRETGRETASDANSTTIAVKMKDEYYPFEAVKYVKTWNDCAAVETWIEIRHSEEGPVRLVRADSFAAPVAAPADAPVRVISLAGQAKYEANVCETSLAKGQYVELVSNAGTRDAWESNPAMMVAIGDKVDEEDGTVLGVALEWSGTNRRRIRRNWDGKRLEVFAGIDMTSGPYTLDSGVAFATPRAILVKTDKGKGEVSRQFHRWAHRHLMPHGYDLHPVLLNSWEGSYFSFTEQTLIDMMDGVKAMGGEMFVLDDGWFGRGKFARDDVNRAKAGLGDWCVNREKLPRGLGWLAQEAEKRGLKFGLWVEPEMANTNSWLYSAHPEWALREKGRPLVCGRGGSQVVLDYTNPAVRDDIFSQIDATYSDIEKESSAFAFVKWDCNANIWNLGSTYLKADRQPNLWYDYNMGYVELMGRFLAKRPGVMTQACASGGGRMDFGSLRYADEFWGSDDTDPYQRIFIQWGALQFYPASAMACHVTASPNHQTKRETPLKYRFDVAMTGRMGFELHPKDLTPEEFAFAKAAVADYKRIRPTVQRGDLYRLVSPYESPLASLMYVEDGNAALFALGLKINGERRETLRLRGLVPDAKYSVREINLGERRHAKDVASATGRELMENGLEVLLSGDYDSAVFEVSPAAAR